MNKTNININLQHTGRFKAEILKDGEVVREYPWSDNIVVDEVIDTWMEGQSTSPSYCQVGTGSTPESASDTQLETFLAETNDSTWSDTNQIATAPYYVQHERIYTFPLGGVVGNISEVGTRTSAGTSGTFISRALFKDGMGDPTTITVLADEQLRITYQLRRIFPDTDIVTTVDGYSVTLRAADVDNQSNAWTAFRGIAGYTVNNAYIAYTGTIGSITSIPSSSAGISDSSVWTAYTPGSFTRTVTATWGINSANDALQSFKFEPGNSGNEWQFQVSPTINKTSDEILEIDFTITASRP